MSLNSLDGIFKSLNRQAKALSEESLLVVKSSTNQILNLKINIIKHVVEVIMKESLNKTLKIEKREKKQTILGLIEEKKNEGLKNMSVDDLVKMYDDLK